MKKNEPACKQAICLTMLEEETKRYNEKIISAQRQHNVNVHSILGEWAAGNARFGEGDVIATPDKKKIIRIQSVHAMTVRPEGKARELCVTYTGRLLNEDLSESMDAHKTTLCDINESLVKLS